MKNLLVFISFLLLAACHHGSKKTVITKEQQQIIVLSCQYGVFKTGHALETNIPQGFADQTCQGLLDELAKNKELE